LEGDWELAGTELPDIYVGQVVNEGESIGPQGYRQRQRGATVDCPASCAGCENHLPKLIWMKRRIESLLQDGKTKEAIALAEKANLVCRGAAFIAWDEAEEVAIAQDEVYRPSLDIPSSVSCSTPAPGVSFMPATGAAAFMPAR
jgi:hypothetical protein